MPRTHIASVIDDLAALVGVAHLRQRCLVYGCRLAKRKRRPSTYQRLLVLA